MRRDSPRVQICAAVVALIGGTVVGAQPQWQDVIRNLRHPKAETRLDAVNRLGRSSYVEAIDPLAPLIRDPDDRVQAAAIDAELSFFLSDRVSDRRVFGMSGSKSRAQRAFEAGPLIRTATPAPPALVEILTAAIRDENARVRFDAVHALGFIAEPPLDSGRLRALADELDHYDPVIRAATARVLGRLHQREAGDRLLAAVDDSSAVVRQFAIESIGLVREDRALPRLRDLVARAGNRNVDGLVLAIARIGSPDDLTYFTQLLTARSAGARRAGAEGIGRVGDQRSVAALEQVLAGERVTAVRMAVLFALDRLGRPQAREIAATMADEERVTQARDYLFEIGRDAVPGVGEALAAATDSRHRADLVQVIGYLGSDADLATVQPLLQDADVRVQRAAHAAVTRLRR